MYKILETKELAANIFYMVVEAKRVAKACKPGQFVIVRTDEEAERIPLTICDYDAEKGTEPEKGAGVHDHRRGAAVRHRGPGGEHRAEQGRGYRHLGRGAAGLLLLPQSGVH